MQFPLVFCQPGSWHTAGSEQPSDLHDPAVPGCLREETKPGQLAALPSHPQDQARQAGAYRCSKIPWLLGRPSASQAGLYCISFSWPHGSTCAPTQGAVANLRARRQLAEEPGLRAGAVAFWSLRCCLQFMVRLLCSSYFGIAICASESCRAAEEYVLLLLLLFLSSICFFYF